MQELPLPGGDSSISFPTWKSALAAAALPPDERAHFERQIIRFLHYCRTQHAPVSAERVRRYFADEPARALLAREALRWFFRAARKAAGTTATGAIAQLASSNAGTLTKPGITRSTATPPPLAREDLGGADWERDLITAIRRRGFLWRTEQTYRAWAQRFAEYVRPRSPYAAEGDDLARFLTKLAVEHRVSRSTQKQALNALVFFLQEALKRSAGELEFAPARTPRRPAVSTNA